MSCRAIPVVLILMLVFSGGCTQNPPPLSFLDDQPAVLSAEERARIEGYHRRLHEDLGIHLRIVILKESSPDLDAEAQMLFGKHLGDSTRGVLLLLDFPGRQVRLEVGYDLEPVFTDLAVARMAREQLAPFFAAGRLGAGLEGTVELLAAAALATPESPSQKKMSLPHLSGGGGAGIPLSDDAPPHRDVPRL